VFELWGCVRMDDGSCRGENLLSHFRDPDASLSGVGLFLDISSSELREHAAGGIRLAITHEIVTCRSEAQVRDCPNVEICLQCTSGQDCIVYKFNPHDGEPCELFDRRVWPLKGRQ
jgi:hypothetical protein